MKLLFNNDDFSWLPVLLAFAAFFFVRGIISDTRLFLKNSKDKSTKNLKQRLNSKI